MTEQTYSQLFAETIDSITLVLYDRTDCNHLIEGLGKPLGFFDIKPEDPEECYELVRFMKFELLRVYSRKGYSTATRYPTDWTGRMLIAMSLRDKLEAAYLEYCG